MNIKIYQDRKLLNEDSNFGSENENLATTLVFEIPEYIEKDGVQIATKDLNKTIVFDIEGDNELPIDEDNKFSFPYEITKLGEVVWNICLKEKSETEDMTDKLIWYSETMKSTFIKTNEGHNEITTEKIDVFNSMLTRLNNGVTEVEELKVYIEDFKKDVDAGKFNGKDGVDGKDGQDGYSPVKGKDYWTPEDKTEIINEIDNKVQEDLKNYYLKSETYNKEEIDNKISLIPKFDIKVVDKLPTENIEEATVYLVKSGEESQNLYTEYIYADGIWEQLGTQKLDLSGFYNKDEINALLATRDSKITALEEENKIQADRIKELEEEVESLEADYKPNEITGETVVISDGRPKSKIEDTIYGMSKQNTTEGYQLFNKDEVVNNKYINNLGEILESGYFSISHPIPVISGGNITYRGLTDVGTAVYSNFYNENDEVVETFKQAVGVNTKSVPSNATYVIFSIRMTNDDINTFQVVNGTEEKPYEPYTGGQASPNTEYKQDIEVITECSLVQRGKNFFDKSKMVKITGVTAEDLDNNVIRVTTNEVTNYNWVKYLLGDVSKYVGKKIYVTGNLKASSTNKARILIAQCDKDGNALSGSSVYFDTSGVIKSIEIVKDETYHYLQLTLYGNTTGTGFNAGAYSEYSNVIVTDLEDTTFEPYIEPIVHSIDLAGNSIAKVGEITDLLNIGVDGRVKIGDKVIKRYVFTGDETFTVATTGSGLKYFNFTGIFNDNGSNSIYMNYFRKISKSYSELIEKGDYCTWATNELTRLAIMCKDYDTVEDFKAWIKEKYDSGEPLYIDYVLAKEYRETINLPSIEPITLFEGITNVFELVTNLGTTMKMEYKISNKSRLEKLELALLSNGGNV